MQIHIRDRTLVALLLVLIFTAALVWHFYPASVVRTETTVLAPEVPVIMRTSGGLLEVGVIRAQERFTRHDSREFWGIDLGTTTSHIQAPAFYRYHIQLAKEWKIIIRGKTCIVTAPQIQPSLPVAFDTSAVQKYSQNGWARFNKDDNLATLERSITPELEKRARSDTYRELVTAPARKTVEEFVTKWLLKEQKGWGSGPDYKVQVIFPGDPPAGVKLPLQD